MLSEEKKAFTPRVPRRYLSTYRPREDAWEKARGIAQFADDISLKRSFPNMLYAKVLTSPYPHAIIKSIDTRRAEALAGVKAVITYTDPEISSIKPTSTGWTDGTGTNDYKRSFTFGLRDRVVLGNHARWVGDEVGVVVAAESEELAEEALRLMDIEWEVLPFILTVEDALGPDAPIIHPEMDPESNVIPDDPMFGTSLVLDQGNVDKAFAEAEVVVETTCRYGDCTQAVLDYWSCMASWQNERLTIWSNAYAADQTRMHLSEMLELPLNRVRVVSPYVGGSHGRGDSGEQPFFLFTSILAKRTGRPVKYRHNRTQSFHDGRTSVVGKCKVGSTRSGKISAIEMNMLGDSGAYADHCIAALKFVPREWMELSLGHVPNLRIVSRGVYTNHLPSSCVRSIGNIQSNYTVGLALDKLAELLAIDPVELVIKNAGYHHSPVPNPSLEGVLREGAKRIGWSQRHAAGKGEWLEGTKKRGIGFSFHNTWHAAWQEYRRGPIQVLMKVNSDGSVILQAPTIETGPGSNSCAVFACADALGVRTDDILWMAIQDTDMGLKDQVQTDSVVSHVLPEVIYRCAAGVKKQLLEMAGRIMEVNPDELDLSEGRFFIKSSPDVGMTIKELYAKEDLMAEGTLVPVTGFEAYRMPPEDTGISYMATFAEVEVDTETGQIEVLKMVVCTDGGTVMYPSGAEGQLTGGQCQGLGEALSEGMIYDEATGIPLNFNFVDYKVATMADFPEIEPVPMEIWKGNGEFGACGMGESAPCCTPRAIANAVYNALGVRVEELPITPLKVLNALNVFEAFGKDGE